MIKVYEPFPKIKYYTLYEAIDSFLYKEFRRKKYRRLKLKYIKEYDGHSLDCYRYIKYQFKKFLWVKDSKIVCNINVYEGNHAITFEVFVGKYFNTIESIAKRLDAFILKHCDLKYMNLTIKIYKSYK